MTDRYEAVYRAMLEGPAANSTADESEGEPELLAARRQDRMGALSGR